MSAPRHERLAQQIADALGYSVAPPARIAAAADRLTEWEAMIEANAVVYLHADRLTVEPTYLGEDTHLRPLLAAGEVALALRPFPSGDGAVVLYGSPEQIREILDSAAAFAEEDL